MVRGFSAPRCSLACAVTIPRHRDKERIVGRRERHPRQPREMRITFEPSRLSHAWIAQAYEQVVPVIRRTPPRSAQRDEGKCKEAQQPSLPGGAASLG
jgi:hypothetical protein